MRRLFALLALMIVCHAAYTAELFGTVDSLSGSASVSEQNGNTAAVYVGQKIYEGQTISSGPDSEVHIVSEDGGIIALRPDTVFRVDEYKAEGGSSDKIFMSLLGGAIRSITGWIGKHDNSAYRLTTPTVTLGIRGTDHEVTVIDKGDGDEPGTYDTVNEGATVMKSPHGEAEVTPGKFAFAPKGRAVAPQFLAQHPRFWARRRLRLEDRIPQRKEYMRGRFEQMREERIRHMQQIRGVRQDNIRTQENGRAMERRNELREGRTEQIRQRREQNQERRREKMQKGGESGEGSEPYRHREMKKHMRREGE